MRNQSENTGEEKKRKEFLARQHPAVVKVNEFLKIIENGIGKEIAIVSYCMSRDKDIFTHLCNLSLPEFYEDKGGFFNPANHKPAQDKKCFMGDNHQIVEKQEEAPKINREEMIKNLVEMDLIKALSFLRYMEQKDIVLDSRYDNVIADSSIYRNPYFHYMTGKRYRFSH